MLPDAPEEGLQERSEPLIEQYPGRPDMTMIEGGSPSLSVMDGKEYVVVEVEGRTSTICGG